MVDSFPANDFVEDLLRWHDDHGRHDLPWRDSGRSPFKILVAEVLLQRTTAAQVRQVYPDLVENFPTPEAMETESRDELGNEIAPLGLRKRAGYLKTLAGQLVERHGGAVPNTYSELTELHGVGDYTAASVLVHAYGKEAAPVDTNVARIFARVHDLDQGSKETNEEIRELAETLCPSDRRSDFVHALLDLGATTCTARSPSCSDCPVSAYCRSQSESPKRDG